MAYKFTKSMEVGNTIAKFSMLSFKTFLENGHLLGLDFLGNVDVRSHGFVVGVAGPFHHHLGRNATSKCKTYEGTAASSSCGTPTGWSLPYYWAVSPYINKKVR